jgi:hypothetical protein
MSDPTLVLMPGPGFGIIPGEQPGQHAARNARRKSRVTTNQISPHQRWTSPAWVWAATLSSGAVLLAVLFFFPPGQYGFYPRCLLHTLTGLQCPGCGGLRAVHQLLHGHVAAAFAYNPLFVLALPWLGGLAVWQSQRLLTGRPLVNPFRRPAIIWAVATLVVAFTVARNLAGPG